MKSMLRRTTFREIKQSLGRYLAIFSIVALGVGFFAGLRTTKPAMVETGNEYLEEVHFFDFRLLNNYGFEEEDVAVVEAKEDVEAAQGSVSMDAICTYEDGTESVLAIHSITEKVNNISLMEGRLPELAGECVVDADMDEIAIGDTIRISNQNEEDTREMFAEEEYVVVGKVKSPLYLNFERGTTGLLNGKKNGFLYLLPESFECDYFTEIYVRLDHNFPIYSEEYTEYIETKEAEFEALSEEIARNRYNSIYKEAMDEIDKKEKELGAEFAEANEMIAVAREELSNLDEPEAYLLLRNTNVGYVLFENDVQIVEGVSRVFPVFFFLIAALVCVTTMNRMVEEQRTQIGVLKALGYSRRKIMGKYTFYAGSAAIGGAVIGFFAGSYVFPMVIWQAYNIMYGFREDIVFILDIPLAVISLLVALICSVGATYVSCRHELNSVAAELMRPKAPRGGKRIFLEKLTFVWKHMKFLHKVSIRNVFRYKKRFFMMTIGISGCTALLVAGYGIKNSISNLVPEQYEEIQLYDLSVTFEEELSAKQEEEFENHISDIADNTLIIKEESVDLVNEDIIKSVTLIVPRQEAGFEDFICLKEEDGNKISYPGKGEVVLTHKVAERLGVGVGDTIVMQDADRKEATLTISGIAINYVYSYAYIAKESYEEGFGKEIAFTNCLVNLIDKDSYNDANVKVTELPFVISSSANQTFAERFDSMMSSLDAIVVLVIVCAAVLAFIVLYNLTNINITERIREIATIKVLGFYPNETASYVFRENIVLTFVGSLIGLFLGKLLLQYVMYNIDVNAVTFKVYIAPLSYLLSVLLTFLFAAFVNWVMYFKLKKINMAESLKSIE